MKTNKLNSKTFNDEFQKLLKRYSGSIGVSDLLGILEYHKMDIFKATQDTTPKAEEETHKDSKRCFDCFHWDDQWNNCGIQRGSGSKQYTCSHWR